MKPGIVEMLTISEEYISQKVYLVAKTYTLQLILVIRNKYHETLGSSLSFNFVATKSRAQVIHQLNNLLGGNAISA